MGLRGYIGITSYAIILIFYIFSLKCSAEVGKQTNRNSAPTRLKALGQFKFHFFTIWTFVLQILFLLIAISDEVSKLLNLPLPLQKRLGRARASLFNILVFPCSALVVTIFWTIWHIDRELIFPRIIDPFFPLWLNHTMHTSILLPLAIELILPKKYSYVRFENAAPVLVVYLTFYQLLYMSLYLRFGIWLYPIYGVLNWTQRLLFTLFQLSLCVAYQKIGIAIQDRKRISEARKIA